MRALYYTANARDCSSSLSFEHLADGTCFGTNGVPAKRQEMPNTNSRDEPGQAWRALTTRPALAQPSPAARGPRRSLAVAPPIRIEGTTV